MAGKLRRVWPCKRRGMTMIMFALVFVLLISFLGLVIDGGFLLASHRRTQNAADAAALAAAFDRMRGRSVAAAIATAEAFVSDYNHLNGATVTVHIPPSSLSPYAGDIRYVEVIASYNVSTFLMHAVGMAPENAVVARAVAGYEATSAGEGVIVLDPTARPGLNAQGNGTIRVLGRVVVNSHGEGVDEFGNPVDMNGNDKNNDGNAASAGKDGSTYGIFAQRIDVVGGVDNPEHFKHISEATGFEHISPIERSSPDGETLLSEALFCRWWEEPDPLIDLPTPTTSNGVNPTKHLSVSVGGTASGVWKDPDNDPPPGRNFQAQGWEGPVGDGYLPEKGDVILFPGIYEGLKITGGKVYLVPGIYVISPQKNDPNPLDITGGTVIANGVMFYNTSKSYSPGSGTPDANDGGDKTPLPSDEHAGGIKMNAGMIFTPIDTQNINYSSMYEYMDGDVRRAAPSVSEVFDGMLFYQRRRNKNSLEISGNAADGKLQGTLYAKWSTFNISGQGTYDAQFVCGSMHVTGQGNVTILGAGDNWGRANRVFLVE